MSAADKVCPDCGRVHLEVQLSLAPSVVRHLEAQYALAKAECGLRDYGPGDFVSVLLTAAVEDFGGPLAGRH